jgi:hypothetical protein
MKNLLLKWSLTRPMISMIIKGALPPTIATAIGQSLAFSTVYGNFGFVITLATVLSLHLLPRHRYLKNLIVATVCLFLGICAHESLTNPRGLQSRSF